MELKFNVNFSGREYLVEVTPVMNGKDMSVRPDMFKAEEIQKIYSRQIQAMLQQHEIDYKDTDGLLVAWTSEGFQFENIQVEHGDQEWEDFVQSLFYPAETIAAEKKVKEDEKKASDKIEKRNKFPEYKGLTSYEKKQVMISVYLKKAQEFYQAQYEVEKVVDYTPIEQQCLDCRNYIPFDLENEVTNLRIRLHKHRKHDDSCNEKKLTREEDLYIARNYIAIERAAREAAAHAP
jgi:hypothetical protein